MKLVRHLSLAAVVVFSACELNPHLTKLPAAGTSTQEIQGGTRDNSSSNVVAIIINTPNGLGICSGSLIAPNLVLTAHHCVADSNTTACTSSGFGTTFAANSFRITPSATAAASVFGTAQVPVVDNSTWFTGSLVSLPTSPVNNICGGDMALIRLATNITSICPLIPRVDSAVALNENYTAVGFGVTSPSGSAAGTRYSLPGFVGCEANCGQGTNATLEWNGANNTGGVCEGDSGGPALDSQRRVLGTVSRGSGVCGDALYESVFGQGAWIKSVAAAAATAGGYPAAAWVTGGSTSINSCTGVDGGTGGGAGGGAGGGGGFATGGGAGGGGGSTGTCNAGTTCVDASGAGGFACLDPSTSTGVPANAPACSQTVACANGFSCWQTGTSTSACLQDCVGTLPVGGGAGGGVPAGGGTGTGGGVATGGGGGSSGGSCTNAATTCVDASGQGKFACVDVNSTTGIPAGAPTCSTSSPCPSNYNCWGTANGNFCLQNCTPGGTGGGAGGGGGVPVGGGTGTGGGFTTGGGTGTGGGFATGGGTGGGTFTGGGTGTGGGSATGGSGGSAGAGGGFMFPGLPEQPKKTGCSCSEVPSGAIWLALAGLTLVRRRRNRTA